MTREEMIGVMHDAYEKRWKATKRVLLLEMMEAILDAIEPVIRADENNQAVARIHDRRAKIRMQAARNPTFGELVEAVGPTQGKPTP